jgi:hypothetical protein
MNLFSGSILLKGKDDGNGKEYSAVNERAIVQYSSNSYNKICLEFSSGEIPNTCNKISVSDYSKDNFLKSGSKSGTKAGSATKVENQTITINQI